MINMICYVYTMEDLNHAPLRECLTSTLKSPSFSISFIVVLPRLLTEVFALSLSVMSILYFQGR